MTKEEFNDTEWYQVKRIKCQSSNGESCTECFVKAIMDQYIIVTAPAKNADELRWHFWRCENCDIAEQSRKDTVEIIINLTTDKTKDELIEAVSKLGQSLGKRDFDYQSFSIRINDYRAAK